MTAEPPRTARPAAPRVSVIVPALQEEELLASTLACFPPTLRERFGIELIVSDGGSTDGTVRIARAAADAVVERNPQCRENIAIGRNHGARAARGDILVFINADVRVASAERFFERMLATIARDEIVAATCTVRVFPEEERLSDRLFHRFFNDYAYLLNVLGMGMGRGECHVMRRDVFDRIGGYNEALAAGEDYELFVRLRRLGSIAFLKDLTVYESPRRYRRYGYAWIATLWYLNGLWALLFKRSFVQRWKPVR